MHVGLKVRVFTKNHKYLKHLHGRIGIITSIKLPCIIGPQDECMRAYVSVKIDGEKEIGLTENCVSRVV